MIKSKCLPSLIFNSIKDISYIFVWFHCFPEPALLYQDLTVVSSVLQHDIKYYKYRVTNITGPLTVHLKQTEGQTGLQASLVNKNPRKTSFNWDICNNNIRRVKRASPSCSLDPNTFVSQQKDGGIEKFLTVHTCVSDFLFVSVEGINLGSNKFNLTLINGTVVLNNTNSSRGLNISSNTHKVRKMKECSYCLLWKFFNLLNTTPSNINQQRLMTETENCHKLLF